MSLSGTFETLAVTDVLGLLAGSAKTGSLRLEAGEVAASIFLVDGRCSAAESGDLAGPVAGEKELEERLLEVCFEVARQDGGSFAFDAGAEPGFDVPHRIDVASAVAELDDLLEQWREVQQIVPSLDHRPRLDPHLEVEVLELDRERWKLVVAVDGRRSVRQIQQRLGGGVLEVCREVASLVEVGAIGLLKPGRTGFADVDPEDDDADAPRSGVRIVPSPPYGPGVDDVDGSPDRDAVADEVPAPPAEPADAAERVAPEATDAPDVPAGELVEDERGDAEDVAAAVAALRERGDLPGDLDADDVRDRGALLRLFSSLRDS